MITKKYAEGFCWLCVVSVASLLESLSYVSPHLSQLNGFSLACSFSWTSKRFWSANFFSQFEQLNVFLYVCFHESSKGSDRRSSCCIVSIWIALFVWFGGPPATIMSAMVAPLPSSHLTQRTSSTSGLNFQIGIFFLTKFLMAAFAWDSDLASVTSIGALFHNSTLGNWKLVSLIFVLKNVLSLIWFDDLVSLIFWTLSKMFFKQ